jgi:arylsulfatase A-like enzyme
VAIAQAIEPGDPMRALALLGVLLIAKLLVMAGRPLPLSGWVPVAYLWQDALVALAFGALDRSVKQSWFGWTIYCAAIPYIAVNVAIERVLSSPLTWPMIGAARGALSDSIKHHSTPSNIALASLVLAAGLALPFLVGRLRRLYRTVIVIALLIVGLGPLAVARVETNGLDRNPLLALATTALPRLSAAAAETKGREAWRASPFGSAATNADDLTRFHGAAKTRNVVMVFLESAGASYLRPYGAPNDPMPSLTEMAKSAILFENAYSVYPESIKGLFSVLCSRYPAMDTDQRSYDRIVTPGIASVLKSAGYHTALFHSGRFMYLGMEAVVQNRGYEVLEDAGAIGGNAQSSFGVDDPSTVQRALAWVDSLPRNDRFFLTYLPIAGHHPYDTPEPGPFPERKEQDRYLNALHYSDTSLSALLRGLRDRCLDQKTLFVIFGDHGEAFGQHPGNFAHSQFVYEENIHVPYFISLPGTIDRQVRVLRPISLIDTAPTILDLLGLSPPFDYQGSSVLNDSSPMALFYTDYSLGLLGLRDGPWKYIYELESRRSELFDLDHDPSETADLSPVQHDRTAAYHDLLMRWSESQKALIQRETASNWAMP